MNPKISIIIPCFNHGQYLLEALQSVERCNNKDLFEIIIINDGSTDGHTIQVLKDVESNKDYRVIHQPNQGLGAARNNAIRQARGEYILPLDSDNRLRPAYITKSITILDNNPSVAIVYGNAWRFGDEELLWNIGPFDQQLLMVGNYIDACAVFRKKMWEDLGGYDDKMPVMGVEDWDFWLRASFKGYMFHYIPEVLFDYRVMDNSMIRSLDKEKSKLVCEYIFKKHFVEYYQNFRKCYLLQRYLFKAKWYKRPFKILFYVLGCYKPVIPPFFIYDKK